MRISALALSTLSWDPKDVNVTRQGRGPGKVTYKGQYAGEVRMGKGNVPYFHNDARWMSSWASARFLRDRATNLFRQLMKQHVQPSGKVNSRRMRNRSHRAASSKGYS
ncbi:hypothetical protein BH11PAT4_BH11PAT4_5660 [soil metagenome]